MATKKDIKDFLKSVNLTESDIDKMWKEAADKNRLIASLIKQNIDWRTLDMRLIKQIPDEKQNQIKREQERKMKEQEELDRKEKELKIKQEKNDL